MLQEKHDKILKDKNLKKKYEELKYESEKILELEWEFATRNFGVVTRIKSYVDDLNNQINIHVDSYNRILEEIFNYVNEYKRKSIKK